MYPAPPVTSTVTGWTLVGRPPPVDARPPSPRATERPPPDCSGANPGCRGRVPAGHPRGAAAAGGDHRAPARVRGRTPARPTSPVATWRRSSSRSRSRRRPRRAPTSRSWWRRSAPAVPGRTPSRGEAGARIAALGDRPAGRRVHRPAGPARLRHPGRVRRRRPATSSRAAATCTSRSPTRTRACASSTTSGRGTRCCSPCPATARRGRAPTTGYASYRSQVWGAGRRRDRPRRSVTRPATARSSTSSCAPATILDEGMVYFDARLSSRYPTVEVRVADVCLDADDAALQAALVRGIAETATGEPVSQPRTELLRAATWRAARSGLTRRPGQPADRASRCPRPRWCAAGRARPARPGGGRRPGVGGTPGGHRAAARQRRHPAAGWPAVAGVRGAAAAWTVSSGRAGLGREPRREPRGGGAQVAHERGGGRGDAQRERDHAAGGDAEGGQLEPAAAERGRVAGRAREQRLAADRGGDAERCRSATAAASGSGRSRTAAPPRDPGDAEREHDGVDAEQRDAGGAEPAAAGGLEAGLGPRARTRASPAPRRPAPPAAARARARAGSAGCGASGPRSNHRQMKPGSGPWFPAGPLSASSGGWAEPSSRATSAA